MGLFVFMVNMVGKISGRLEVVEEIGKLCRCRCQCGNYKMVTRYNITSQHTRSCGCLRSETVTALKCVNIVGSVYGRLTVLSKSETYRSASGRYRSRWLCQCECGNTCIVGGEELKSGNTSSCGCLNDQKRSEVHRTHGLRNTYAYSRWCRLKERCECPTNKNYTRYGGKGITVEEPWKSDAASFCSWFVTESARYPEGTRLQVDRIDNNGNYSPSNCRLVTAIVNCNNKGNNRRHTYKGKEDTLANLVREHSIVHYGTAQYRLSKGWTIEEALETPPLQ